MSHADGAIFSRQANKRPGFSEKGKRLMAEKSRAYHFGADGQCDIEVVGIAKCDNKNQQSISIIVLNSGIHRNQLLESMPAINLTINGKQHSIDVDPKTPVLWVLRDHLDLVGTKYG